MEPAAVRVVELTAGVADNAATLAGQHGLREADAVHLASALAVGAQVIPRNRKALDFGPGDPTPPLTVVRRPLRLGAGNEQTSGQ